MIKSKDSKQEQFIIKDLFDGTYKVIALKSVKDRYIETGTLDDDLQKFYDKRYDIELEEWLTECGWNRETKTQKKNVSREAKDTGG